MTGFLTNLIVRNVRFSDKSDCAYGEKINFLSLSFPRRVFATRAQSDLSESSYPDPAGAGGPEKVHLLRSAPVTQLH